MTPEKRMTPIPPYVKTRLDRVERNNRTRAKAMGCEAEKFSFPEVCEEQGWSCTLCGEPMDMLLPGIDSNGITLEHEFALSCGGSHTKSNAAGVHNRCNMQKANKGFHQQRSDKASVAKIDRLSGKTRDQTARREARGGSRIQGRGFQKPEGHKHKWPSRKVGG